MTNKEIDNTVTMVKLSTDILKDHQCDPSLLIAQVERLAAAARLSIQQREIIEKLRRLLQRADDALQALPAPASDIYTNGLQPDIAAALSAAAKDEEKK